MKLKTAIKNADANQSAAQLGEGTSTGTTSYGRILPRKEQKQVLEHGDCSQERSATYSMNASASSWAQEWSGRWDEEASVKPCQTKRKADEAIAGTSSKTEGLPSPRPFSPPVV